MSEIKAVIVGFVLLSSLSGGCTIEKQETLEVLGGEPVTYGCENGIRIVARYYSLSDSSLHFVKLMMSDGTRYTLPNVVSASGARYTDDRELIWWTKGDSAFVQIRNQAGEWNMMYQHCGIIYKRN